MYKWFFELLEHYLRTHPIAKSVLLEMGFRLVLADQTDIRRPDLGVILNDNPVPLEIHDNSYQGTFDLCIEALSDSSAKEIKRDTVKKKGEYAAAGIKEYYILYGQGEPMEFYRLGAKGVYVPIKRVDKDLIQSSVLPGFQFRISDLFNKPSPEEMIDDPVYQGFVLPGYSEAKKRVQRAQRRAEAAEAEIARLKALLAAKNK